MSPEEVNEKAMEAAWTANLVQADQLRRARTWTVVDRFLQFLLVVGLLYVVMTNRTTLDEIRSQTSPERQLAQRQAVDRIVLTIECNNRQAIQDALDLLEERGVIQPGDASIVGGTCKGDGGSR